MTTLPYLNDVQEYIADEPNRQRILAEHVRCVNAAKKPAREETTPETTLREMREKNRSVKAKSRGKASRDKRNL